MWEIFYMIWGIAPTHTGKKQYTVKAAQNVENILLKRGVYKVIKKPIQERNLMNAKNVENVLNKLAVYKFT